MPDFLKIMYKGRHCQISDYQYLNKNINEFLNIINRDNFDLKDYKKYIDTFSDFDIDIAFKIRFNLEKEHLNKNKIIDLLEELKTNVYVDIKEHK